MTLLPGHNDGLENPRTNTSFFLFFLPLVRNRDGTLRRIRAGRRSRGNEESTVSQSSIARLHGPICFTFFLLIFTSPNLFYTVFGQY